MTKGNIPLFRPTINTSEALEALRPILNSGWLGQGSIVETFENNLKDYLGVDRVLTTSSCTAALHLAIKALGLNKGDRVLTTPISFVSTAMVLLYEDLVPVFCDINLENGGFDSNKFYEILEKESPKAILAVHLGGFPANLEELYSDSIPVIEDCAHAFGALHYGSHYPQQLHGASLRCWSFHAVKNLGIGDGGAITTNNEDTYKRLKKLRWMGINKSTIERNKEFYQWEYDIEETGYKYNMTDIMAALGIVQLESVDKGNCKRRQIADRYLADINTGRPFQFMNDTTISSCHFLPILFDNRDRVIKSLRRNSIDFGMHYKPIYKFAPFRNGIDWESRCPNAEEYYQKELTLPMHTRLKPEDLDRIISAVNYDGYWW